MLCLPGFTPVWNVDHATGEIGGTVEPSGLKAALVAQRGEVGQLSLFEHLLGEPMVHPVEAEDHHPLHPAPPQRSPPEQGPRQQTERPGEDCDESREDRGEDREERARPARTRPRGRCRPGPGSGPGR